MTAQEIERWLSESAWLDYLACKEIFEKVPMESVKSSAKIRIETYASLAEWNRLMEKYEWVKFPWVTKGENHIWMCLECNRLKNEGHTPDCAIGKHIAGYPRDVKGGEVKK